MRPVIFMDNASYHRSNAVAKRIKELQMVPVFNLPYRPDMNCAIEHVNSILKQ